MYQHLLHFLYLLLLHNQTNLNLNQLLNISVWKIFTHFQYTFLFLSFLINGLCNSSPNCLCGQKEQRYQNTVVSVGPSLEKFNIVSNDQGRTQNCDFCVSIGKTNFKDHHTPDKIHGFRDLVLVSAMHDCYCTKIKHLWFRAFLFLTIKRCKRLQLLDQHMKTNHSKMILNVFNTTYTYSNCIVYRLFYC